MSTCKAKITYNSTTREFIFTRDFNWRIDPIHFREMSAEFKRYLIHRVVCADCMQLIVNFWTRGDKLGTTTHSRVRDYENNKLVHKWTNVAPDIARVVLLFDDSVKTPTMLNTGKLFDFKLNYVQTEDRGFSASIEFTCISENRHVVQYEYDPQMMTLDAEVLEKYEVHTESWRPFQKISDIKAHGGRFVGKNVTWAYKTPGGIMYGKLEMEQEMSVVGNQSDYVANDYVVIPYERITIRHLVDLFNDRDDGGELGIICFRIEQ